MLPRTTLTIYFYDGANLGLFDSRSSATIQSSATRWISDWQTVEVEVTKSELTFVALDTADKSGTTQLRIGGIERIGALLEEPDLTFSVTPDDSIGAVTDAGVISTGFGSVSSQVLTDTFFHNQVDLTLYGQEGSAALWSTEPGFHQLTFEIFTTEPDVNQDQFLFWDGQALFKLSDRSLATTPSGNGFTSGDITIEVNAVSDEWGIVALDMGDAAGDSEIRLKAIEWYGDGEAAPLPEPDLDPPHNEPEQTSLPVSWGNITDSSRSVQGEFLGEILGVWNDPSDSYSFYVDNPSVIRFEVQEVAATSVGFEAYYENELVSDGLIMGYGNDYCILLPYLSQTQ